MRLIVKVRTMVRMAAGMTMGMTMGTAMWTTMGATIGMTIGMTMRRTVGTTKGVTKMQMLQAVNLKKETKEAAVQSNAHDIRGFTAAEGGRWPIAICGQFLTIC